jgi:hypothetical protein
MDAEEDGHGAPAEEPACRPAAALRERHLLPALGDLVHPRPRQALLLLTAVRLESKIISRNHAIL